MCTPRTIYPVVVFLLAILAGCTDSSKPAQPAPQPVQQPKTAPTLTTTPTTTSTELPPPPTYAYNPSGRRDPFTPLIVKEEKKSLVGTKTPLERYAIYDFKLSGIVWGGLGYHAMVEGPDGKGYFIKTGTIIGPNRGVVKKITQNTVTIEEQYRDASGELNKKETVIELRKKQEGTP